MSRRDCDLEELIRFQKKMLSFCENLHSMGMEMMSRADEAAALLKDDASRHSIERVNQSAERLRNIGSYGEACMTEYLCKTQAELEQWLSLQ